MSASDIMPSLIGYEDDVLDSSLLDSWFPIRGDDESNRLAALQEPADTSQLTTDRNGGAILGMPFDHAQTVDTELGDSVIDDGLPASHTVPDSYNPQILPLPLPVNTSQVIDDGSHVGPSDTTNGTSRRRERTHNHFIEGKCTKQPRNAFYLKELETLKDKCPRKIQDHAEGSDTAKWYWFWKRVFSDEPVKLPKHNPTPAITAVLHHFKKCLENNPHNIPNLSLLTGGQFLESLSDASPPRQSSCPKLFKDDIALPSSSALTLANSSNGAPQANNHGGYSQPTPALADSSSEALHANSNDWAELFEFAHGN
ncbi:hypothetical protein G7Z17_g5779 [Cylindrodendrum hubeiense]|uniref:Uncharacterized protein n=1 Tax=Cylindrodendrum hubeiense TaxID=595255 RepID=A0A9P5H6H0_9HYPO|nr:hypothetical protein G7Z17_g5779 [Cylindrodendrum hubeiense]